jgi:hypothetical protein
MKQISSHLSGGTEESRAFLRITCLWADIRTLELFEYEARLLTTRPVLCTIFL